MVVPQFVALVFTASRVGMRVRCQGQIDELVRSGFAGQVTRGWREIYRRKVAKGAIGKEGSALGEGEMPRLQQLFIDLQLQDAVMEAGQAAQTILQLIVPVALLLLKVLGAKKHPLPPGDSIMVHRHYSSSRCNRMRSLCRCTSS